MNTPPSNSDTQAITANPVATKVSKKILVTAAFYSCFFLVTLWAAYTNNLPLKLISYIPNYDKFGHVILYCIPTYLGHCLWRKKHLKRGPISLPIFPMLFGLFTVTEELIQGFSPHRTLDAGDMLCSLAGIGLGYWLAQRHRT